MAFARVTKEVYLLSADVQDYFQTMWHRSSYVFDFNVLAKTRRNHNFKIKPKKTHTNYFKFSFFNRYITDWNSIPSNIMHILKLKPIQIFTSQQKQITVSCYQQLPALREVLLKRHAQISFQLLHCLLCHYKLEVSQVGIFHLPIHNPP